MSVGCGLLSGCSGERVAEIVVEKKPEGVEEDQKEYAEKYEEENKTRFIPQVVIADVLKLETATSLLDLDKALEACKNDKRITIGLSDYDNETADTTVIDLAVTIR